MESSDSLSMISFDLNVSKKILIQLNSSIQNHTSESAYLLFDYCPVERLYNYFV